MAWQSFTTSVDPDLMQVNSVSDLGPHCLLLINIFMQAKFFIMSDFNKQLWIELIQTLMPVSFCVKFLFNEIMTENRHFLPINQNQKSPAVVSVLYKACWTCLASKMSCLQSHLLKK